MGHGHLFPTSLPVIDEGTVEMLETSWKLVKSRSKGSVDLDSMYRIKLRGSGRSSRI